MTAKLGIVTIGQAPRDDVVPQMARLMGLGQGDILQAGALDGLGPAGINEYAPGPGDFHLATRLNDGSEVIVAEEKILPRVELAVKSLSQKGVGLILLLCNGEFPDFAADGLVIQPQRLVNQTIAGLLDRRSRLGVMVPVPEQCGWVRRSLAGITNDIVTVVASPYAAGTELAEACGKIEEAGCDLAVLYCMGFSRDIGEKVRGLVSMPVLVSGTLVARVIGELAGSA